MALHFEKVLRNRSPPPLVLRGGGGAPQLVHPRIKEDLFRSCSATFCYSWTVLQWLNRNCSQSNLSLSETVWHHTDPEIERTVINWVLASYGLCTLTLAMLNMNERYMIGAITTGPPYTNTIPKHLVRCFYIVCLFRICKIFIFKIISNMSLLISAFPGWRTPVYVLVYRQQCLTPKPTWAMLY